MKKAVGMAIESLEMSLGAAIDLRAGGSAILFPPMRKREAKKEAEASSRKEEGSLSPKA